MKINLVEYVVRNDCGNIDHEATLNKFMEDLCSWEQDNLQESKFIGEAVDKVFDENPNTKLVKPVVVMMAFNNLGFSASEFGRMEKKISDYLANSGRFVSVRGAHGGIQRK